MDARALRERLDRIRKDVRGADLLYEHTTGHETMSVRGRTSDREIAAVERLSVRVWLDGGKMGLASGVPERFDALLNEARVKAEQAAPDAHAGPVARQSGVLGGLGVLDRRYEQVEAEDREEVVLQAEKSVKQVDRRLSATDFVYRDRIRQRRFANTRGVMLEEIDTMYEASGTISSGSDELTLSDRIASRTFASIASLPYGITLAQRLVDLLGPTVSVSGPVRLLLPPAPVARLFAVLAEQFVADNFVPDSGGSPRFFLQPRPDGSPVLDPKIHLQDDGTLPGGLRTASFDDRGVCPIPLTLLREGRVDGRFVDPERAHRHDVRPTGHLTDGILQPRNLMLRAGTRSMNATLSDLGGRVLRIDDLPEGLQGVDLRTGAFRMAVNGVLLEANKPAGCVRGLIVSGNLAEVLSQVVELCSDTDRIGHVDAPGMVVDGCIAGDL